MDKRRPQKRGPKAPKPQSRRGAPRRQEPAKNHKIEGVISVTRSGIGFLADPRGQADIEIPKESLNTALNGDTVEIGVIGWNPRRKRPVGEVLRVIERVTTRFVGIVARERGAWIMRADDRRMYAPLLLEDPKGAHEGDKVLAAFKGWQAGSPMPEADVLEVIGKAGLHETEMRAFVAAQGFDINFPPTVEREADHIAKNRDSLLQQGAASPSRRDMRKVPTFTIDPDDAKDFDDAISFEKLGNGEYEIGVHIADVTHFVTPHSPIDKEAAKRGTSIYLVDRTIPMLPPILSEDLCSLRPDEDRLAFSAIFRLNDDGAVLSRWFGRTVIRSQKRFTYETAQAVLEGAEAGPFRDELLTLDAIAKKIRARRTDEGAISFDQDEVKFKLDEQMRPIGVVRKVRKDTNLLIEDYMLLANREVAEFVSKKLSGKDMSGLFVYRIHDMPKAERIEELAIFLRAIGYSLSAERGKISVQDINRLFKEIEGKPEENLIKVATIRSMAKAIYSNTNIGHFGLAFEYYTHFTSPIRRYPDMMVHRILEATLKGESLPKEEVERYQELTIQSSEREAAAVEAERDSIKFKQVEYMAPKVGQSFDAVISGVTDWGIYVEERESKSEGMVRLMSLKDDFYALDKPNFRVVGQKTKKTYALGDAVRVKLIGASLEERTLDFEIIS